MIIQLGKTKFEINNKYYISPNGDDTNDGLSSSTPFKTYKKAYETASNGDAIFFMKGDHYVVTSSSDNVNGAFYCAKDLLIYSNIKTTTLHFTHTSTARQYYIQMQGAGTGTKLINLHCVFENTKNTGTNYENALFVGCTTNSLVSNCLIEVSTGSYGISLVYDNSSYKCTVRDNVIITNAFMGSNYSGSFIFERNIVNASYPTGGVSSNVGNVIASNITGYPKDSLIKYTLKNANGEKIGIPKGKCSFYSVLLKQGDEYYSIYDENYDIDLKVYKPIEYKYEDIDDLYFNLSDLLGETTINGETFRPVDKFETFSLAQEYNIPLKALGTKSYSELIVANNDIDITMAESVNSLSLTTNQTDGTVVKMVISLDSGTTWNAISSGLDSLMPLNIEVPLKDYNYESDMTEEDTNNYNNARDIILEQGIDKETLSSINFTPLLEGYEKIRFAYAIQTAEGSIAEIDKLTWDFNSTGKMYKMNDNEVEVDIYSHSVLVTPLIDTDIMKTNIVF